MASDMRRLVPVKVFRERGLAVAFLSNESLNDSFPSHSPQWLQLVVSRSCCFVKSTPNS